MPNSYQLRKARTITETLLAAHAQTNMSRATLAKCVAIMNSDEWRGVSFAAGVPTADLDCKAAVLAMLRERMPHEVQR